MNPAKLQRLLRAEQRRALLDRAVACGKLTQEEAAAFDHGGQEPQGAGGDSGFDDILRSGRLSRVELDDLTGELAREDFARAREALLTPTYPAEVETAGADPARRFDDLVLVAPIGRGGTGEVWRAWDCRLGRWVAVKRLAGAGSAAALARFRQEALAIARLAHPHIVGVFRIGQQGDRPHIVMQLVKGEALGATALPPARAAAIVEDVARALHYAHSQGIVHRDLKPSNIVLDGAGQPVVLDFGLARAFEEGDAGLTAPGDVLGTPAYMAPEQTRGEAGAAPVAVDVYGLGATLYHLLGGVPPFSGATFAEVVYQVSHAEPVPLATRVPGIDLRLRAVVGKAMAARPSDRYATAMDLADDLGRFRRGESVTARPEGHLRRFAREARRRPLIGALVLALAALLIALAVDRRRARERLAALGTVRATAQVTLKAALEVRRAGNVTGLRQLLPGLVAAYEQAVVATPELAEPEYLLGRVHRALLDEGEALRYQDLALRKESGFAPALYERAVLRSQRYGRAVERARVTARAAAAEQGSPPTEDSTSDLRAPARPALAALKKAVLADLQALESALAAQPQAPGLGPASLLAARGIFAHHQGEHAQAEGLLRRALAQDDSLEEAWDALARTLAARGARDDAIATYERASALDRGYVPHLLGRCQVRVALARRFLGRDLSQALSVLAAAVADATAALALDAGSRDALLWRGIAHTSAGHQRMLQGQDPEASFSAAEDDLTAAIARDAAAPDVWVARGTMRTYRGSHRARAGGHATADLTSAEADLSRAISLDGEDLDVRVLRGRLRTGQGRHALATGQDPSSILTAARADLTFVIERRPAHSEALAWRGYGGVHLGSFLTAQGRDPEAVFAAAKGDLDAAVTASNRSPWNFMRRGVLHIARAHHRARAAADPVPDLAAAEADLDVAIAALPDIGEFRRRRAEARLEHAAAEKRRGGSGAPWLAAAAQDLASARGDRGQSAELERLEARLGELRAARGR